MLSPEYLDHVADDLLELYGKLDESILRDIVRRLVKGGRVTDTAAWQINRLQEAGLLHEDILSGIAKYSDACDAQVKKLFEDAGITAVNLDMEAYTQAGIHAPPIRMSPAALEILTAGMWKTNGQLKNLTLTTAITSQQAYINAAALAELQVENGLLDYQAAVRRAVQSACSSGTTVSYPSGHVDRLDVAIRRATLTGVNQTMGKVGLQNASEFGCDSMELTAHGGARPKHAEWQGKLVSLSGKKGYLSLTDIGYGSGDGFQGWNCRHNWFPFFPGISTRAYSPEQLQHLDDKRVEYHGKQYSEYEASQIQRQMEREIRSTKRTLAGLDEGAKHAKDDSLRTGFQADFTTHSLRLKEQEKALSNMLKETKRLPDSSRVQVQGFGRSQAQKAVHSAKAEIEKYSKIHYNKDGTIVVTDDWKGKGHSSMPQTYKPNAIIETVSNGGKQIDRTIYDGSGKMQRQIHSGAHGRPDKHPYGEHCHSYTWEEGKKHPRRVIGELTEQDKKENRDILGGENK